MTENQPNQAAITAYMAKIKEISPYPSRDANARADFLTALVRCIAHDVYDISGKDLFASEEGAEAVYRSVITEIHRQHAETLLPGICEAIADLARKKKEAAQAAKAETTSETAAETTSETEFRR